MASRFAHLVGLGRKPAAAPASRAEDDDDKKRDDEMRRLEDDKKDTGETEEEKDARHAREKARAADDDDEEMAEDGDDDSDKEEAHGHGAVPRARRRERGRVAAILSSPHAAQNLQLAVELACTTSMSREEAVRVLSRAPAPSRAERRDRNPQLGPSGTPANAGPPQIQSMWSEAFARVIPGMRSAKGR